MIAVVLKNTFKWVAIVIGTLVAIIALMILVLWFSVNQKTEARIMRALTSHYAPAVVDVKDRADWKLGGSDWSFGGQVCFRIAVRQNGDRSVERVAMVADGDDGGAFEFAREYTSMAQCKADFWRG
ncbi:MAG: hypothetical protein Q8R44_08520 [Novosphingobium sp.]|nr:hypothetical protein [Novosphingobium sp.]